MARTSVVALALALLVALVAHAHAMYSSSGPVKLLDAKGIREMQWKKAAKALDGVVNIAAVDCDKHKELASQFGVQGFPTIKIFGDDKKKPTDYQGQRTAQGIVDAAIAETRKIVKARLAGGGAKKSGSPSPSSSSKKKPAGAKPSQGSGSAVVTLTDSNFDELVLNSGDGAVKLGALDADTHKGKAGEYGIRGFPTIKVFGPTAASAEDAEDYQGPRTAAGITTFALQALDKLGGGLKIKELHSAEVFADFCSGKSSCVVAVLPHLSESGKSGREGYLSTLEAAAKLVRGKPFKFGWLQGGDQAEFERRFELTFGFPSVVAINLDRKRYVVQRGAFAADAIGAFLQGVLQGKEATAGFDAFPALQTVTPWTGEDAAPEVIEDEDDDDILSEILGAGGDAKDEL
ncbi:hypothetical protein PybrP1_012749 [[Pythium] brassicae (nom. inval.)]|nr:hypothetical protein PybrP1_012749 [[Pythium] brassicae (nom. inval.)]